MNYRPQFRRYNGTTATFAHWLAQRRVWSSRPWAGSSPELNTAGPMVLRTFLARQSDLHIHNLALHVASYLHLNATAQWWFPLHWQLAVTARRISATPHRVASLNQTDLGLWLHQSVSWRGFPSKEYRIAGANTAPTTWVKNYQSLASLVTLVDSRSHASSVWKTQLHKASSQFSRSPHALWRHAANAYTSILRTLTPVLRQLFTTSSYFRSAMHSHLLSYVHSMVRQQLLHKPLPETVGRKQESTLTLRTSGRPRFQQSLTREHAIEEVTLQKFSSSMEGLNSTAGSRATQLTLLQLAPLVRRIVARSSACEQDVPNTTRLYRRRDAVRSAAVSGQVQHQKITEEEIFKRVQRTITQECDSLEKRITRQGALTAIELTDQVYSQLVRRLQLEKERLGR